MDLIICFSPCLHGNVIADHSMSGFLQYQKLTAQYYMDLMGKLERMNGTLGTMLRYLDNMQN